MAKTCGERIVDLVSSLKLKKGDRLPGERELAELLKTSRNTVRESLGQFRCARADRYQKAQRLLPHLDNPFHALEQFEPWTSKRSWMRCRAIGPHLAARVAKYAQPDQIRCLVRDGPHRPACGQPVRRATSMSISTSIPVSRGLRRTHTSNF